MAGDEKKAEGAAGGGAGAGGGGAGPNKLVLIISGVNIIITLGLIVILFLSFKKEQQKPAVEDIAATSAESEHGKAKEGEHGGGGEGHGGGHGDSGHGGGHGGGDKKKAVPNVAKMLTLEQFTVNLSTPGSVSPKFARVNISLEVPNDDSEAEVTSRMPQVRNVIIDLFNSKRPSDLATVDGREYLKEEIRNSLNTFLVNGKIKGVFFTNFALSG